MNVLVNYADRNYAAAQRWNTWSARHIAKMDKIFAFHPEDIEITFKESHKDILAEKRGNGLWLWKPYFINKVIASLKDGDTIFYCDAGAIFIRKPQAVYDYLCDENPLFVCDIPLIESCWTKPKCFKEMDCDTDEIKYSNQIIATYFAIYVNDFTRKFIEEWLSYCCRYDLLSPEGLPKRMILDKNYGTNFVSHREDQSIFSLMCKKYRIVAHKDISHRSPESYRNKAYEYRETIHVNDIYKSMLYLHKQPSLQTFFLKRIYRGLKLYNVKKLFRK